MITPTQEVTNERETKSNEKEIERRVFFVFLSETSFPSETTLEVGIVLHSHHLEARVASRWWWTPVLWQASRRHPWMAWFQATPSTPMPTPWCVQHGRFPAPFKS